MYDKHILVVWTSYLCKHCQDIFTSQWTRRKNPSQSLVREAYEEEQQSMHKQLRATLGPIPFWISVRGFERPLESPQEETLFLCQHDIQHKFLDSILCPGLGSCPIPCAEDRSCGRIPVLTAPWRGQLESLGWKKAPSFLLGRRARCQFPQRAFRAGANPPAAAPLCWACFVSVTAAQRGSWAEHESELKIAGDADRGFMLQHNKQNCSDCKRGI